MNNTNNTNMNESKKNYYKGIYNDIFQRSKEYFQSNNIKSMVLGISGGIDSALTAVLASEIGYNMGIPLIGVSMPASTNKDDENLSAELSMKLCDNADTFNIQNLYNIFSHSINSFIGIDDKNIKVIPEGNIKARIRMMILYHIAWMYSGIVLDTDNKTEFLTGFWTRHGDDGDFGFFAQLYKHEIYEFADYLIGVYTDKCKELLIPDINPNTSMNDLINQLSPDKKVIYDKYLNYIMALSTARKLVPTDGNGVSKSDLDQIMPGHTYDDVDDILKKYEDYPDMRKVPSLKYEYLIPLYKKYGEDDVNKLLDRVDKTEFKRKHLPLTINLKGTYNGVVGSNEEIYN